MTDEYSQAISFTNSYFALVDGLAAGLENHLAEDVVLDWFGRTIKGRRNVTAFIEVHKVNSRHMFATITPTSTIGYRKMSLNGRRNSSANLAEKNEKRESDAENVVHEKVENSMTYDLNEDDLCNLFKLNIAPTNVEEIEESINRMKFEEEVTPSIEPVRRREFGQGDGPAEPTTSSGIKYIEAYGQIVFSRKRWKRDAVDFYNMTSLQDHTWKRPCKLQIAYSVSTKQSQPVVDDCRSKVAAPKSRSERSAQSTCRRLPNFQEITTLSDRLVPNVNNFGGYLNTTNFYDDRDAFLRNLQNKWSADDGAKINLFPEYVDNRLIFNRFASVSRETDKKEPFVFNYQIHVIIYEGNNRCRVNLIREFEKHV